MVCRKLDISTSAFLLYHERMTKSEKNAKSQLMNTRCRARVSFDQVSYTAEVTAVGVLRLLEAIRDNQELSGESVRFDQASGSELFGKVQETPQREPVVA